MILFKYLNLPCIPEELLDKPEYILNENELFFNRIGYKAVKVNNILYDWCIENILFHFYNNFNIKKNVIQFNQKIFCYQVIDSKIAPHIDDGRTFTINYILNSGNTNILPTTVFYNNLVEKKQIEEIKIEEKKWHYLKVDIPHSVTNIDSYRLSITMNSTPLNKIIQSLIL